MLSSKEKKIKILNGNIIQTDNGRFIAFFDEFPDLTAEGDSEDDAKERLVRGLAKILEKNKQNPEEFINTENAPIKHFELSAAI